MKALVYKAPRRESALRTQNRKLWRSPSSTMVKVAEDNDLRHRSAHSQGRRCDLPARPHPGHEATAVVEQIGSAVTSFTVGRRSRTDFLHQRLRQMRLLPKADVFALHDRRLDFSATP